MRVRASTNSSLVINLATMFSYPPRLWILTRDNLVLGSASAMNVHSGVGIGVEHQIAIGGGTTVAANTSGGPRVAGHRRTCILIRSRCRLKSMGATGTSTSTGAERADEKVQTLLVEVLRRCDSILEALCGTGGGVTSF
jgi:hypothetical protein